MPVMDGIDALKRILPMRNNCKIVAFSANGLPEDLKSYKDVGFDYIMTKPLSIIELESFLRELSSISEAS